MTVADKVDVDLRVLIGWQFLTPAQRDRIVAALARLADTPLEQWVNEGATRLNAPQPYFVMDGPDGLRVFFRREADGRLTVMDLVLQEFLDRYFPVDGEPRAAS